MNKSFIITESERSRILGLHQEATSRQYLKENEEEWIDQSEDLEGESDFSKADLEKLKGIDKFNQLVNLLKRDKDMRQDLEKTIIDFEGTSEEISEKYKYYDYGDSSGKKEIHRNEYLRRKAMAYGIWGILGAIVGATMGQMAHDQVLEAALLMASMGGTVGAELSSNVGRERVSDDDFSDDDDDLYDDEYDDKFDKESKEIKRIERDLR